MPAISVIIPVYNGEATIHKTIATILQQDFRDYEIIAIDDGSEDNSLKILRSYSAIRVLSQSNRGVSSVRNRGVELAEGKYLAFIDQDDLWMPNKLSKQIKVAEEKKVSYVFTNFFRFRHDNYRQYPKTNSELNNFIYEMTSQCSDDPKVRIIQPNLAMELLLRGYPIYPSTMLIEREVLLKCGGWNSAFPRCQDLDISLRCSKLTFFAYIDEALTGIGRHDTNVSASFLDQLEEDIDVLLWHCQSNYFGDDYVQRIKYWIGRRLVMLGWHYLYLEDYDKARKYYLMSLRYKSAFFKAFFRLPFTFFPLFLIWKLARLYRG